MDGKEKKYEQMYEKVDLSDKYYGKHYFTCWHYIVYYNEESCLDYGKKAKGKLII